jgi:hypothetical protein
MLHITKSQFNRLDFQKSEQVLHEIKGILNKDYPDLYLTRSDEGWDVFIRDKMTELKRYDILEAKNQFIFILSSAMYPYILKEPLPDWALEVLEWPGRLEEDKIILLAKEIYLRNNQ